MPEPELVDLPARHLAVVRGTVAVVRGTVAVEELAAFYDRAFPQIFTALDAAGVVVSDAPMAVTLDEVISWARSQGLTPPPARPGSSTSPNRRRTGTRTPTRR